MKALFHEKTLTALQKACEQSAAAGGKTQPQKLRRLRYCAVAFEALRASARHRKRPLMLRECSRFTWQGAGDFTKEDLNWVQEILEGIEELAETREQIQEALAKATPNAVFELGELSSPQEDNR